jgi:hypothetical protein
MMNRNFSHFGYVAMANDLDAFIPEFWAQETLAILQENMVIANLVHRDFEPIVADMGDIVNTRQPSEFTAVRKDQEDDVTVQDANATNVQVRLNQWLHTTFQIKDGDLSKSMADLVQIYIAPAGLSLGQFVDKALLNQYIGFIGNTAGALGGLTSANARDYVLGAREKLNENKAYEAGRNLILGTNAETSILKDEHFTSAEKRGDGGSALATAHLGHIFGFDTYMCQNMANIATPAAAAFKNGAINLSAGYPKGATSLVVDTFSGQVVAGNWITINGLPYQVVSETATLSNSTGLVITPGLRAPVANDDVIKSYIATTVNFGAGYAAGYAKFITLTSVTNLAVGQSISFGLVAGTRTYTIMQITGSTVLLDRPLDEALTDTTAVNPGPTGGFNLAFHRDAMALVSRPLAVPASGVGARAAVVNGYGLSMRATLSYDARKQAHLVTLDMLFGVKILKTALAAVMLS